MPLDTFTILYVLTHICILVCVVLACIVKYCNGDKIYLEILIIYVCMYCIYLSIYCIYVYNLVPARLGEFIHIRFLEVSLPLICAR